MLLADDTRNGDIGLRSRSELVFTVDKVTCVGHVIGIVVAETRDLAKAGAAAVQVRGQ
jgi:xanthine dehydrogenase molybdopterin-binding subunit B